MSSSLMMLSCLKNSVLRVSFTEQFDLPDYPFGVDEVFEGVDDLYLQICVLF